MAPAEKGAMGTVEDDEGTTAASVEMGPVGSLRIQQRPYVRAANTVLPRATVWFKKTKGTLFSHCNVRRTGKRITSVSGIVSEQGELSDEQ